MRDYFYRGWAVVPYATETIMGYQTISGGTMVVTDLSPMKFWTEAAAHDCAKYLNSIFRGQLLEYKVMRVSELAPEPEPD